MLLNEVINAVIGIAQVSRFNEPMLMMILGIALLIGVQGIRKRMRRNIKL